MSIILIFFAGCGKEIVEPEGNQMPPDYTTLNLTSFPPGAQIYLDGRNSGYVTPCTIKWIEKKNHAVKFKLSLFTDSTIVIDCSNKAQADYFYDYYSDSRNFGVISCTTIPPGAEIYLDGAPLNKRTPYHINNLRPGDYLVKFKYPGYRADSSIATVHAQKNPQDFTILDKKLIDTTKFVDYTRETGAFYGDCVIVDKINRVWFGTAYNGLFVYTNNSFINFTRDNSPLPSNMVNYIFQDSNENIWISTTSGLSKYSKSGNWDLFTKENSSLPVNTINSMCEDKDKNIWMATNKGLVRYKDGAWELFTTGNSPLMGNDIPAIGCAADNSIWIACYNYGISRLHNNQWEHFTPSNSVITNKYINWIYCGPDNSVHIAAAMGAYKRINDVWSSYASPGYPLFGIFGDSDGNIWMSTISDIHVFKNNGTVQSANLYNYHNLAGTTVRYFAQDKNKNIWLATYKSGLLKYKYYN